MFLLVLWYSRVLVSSMRSNPRAEHVKVIWFRIPHYCRLPPKHSSPLRQKLPFSGITRNLSHNSSCMMIITPTKASKNLQPGFIWSIWALSPEDSCFWDHQRKLFVLLFISDFDAWFHIFIIESYRLVTRLFLFNIREVNWLPISAYFYLFNFYH